MPRPSQLFTWATGGSAEISEPPAASRENGWVERIRPPHEWWNWAWNLTGSWLTYLDERTKLYTALDTLVVGLSVGETAELFEDDLASLPGTSLATISAGAQIVDLAVDGRYVYVATATTLRRYARTTGTLATTYTKTNAGNIVRVVTNGDVVVIAYSTYVECFEATGASRWVYNHGATVNDVAVDAVRVYLAGSPDGTAAQVKALSLASGGSVVWSYGHGGTGGAEILYAIATDGRMVYVAGAAAGTGGGTATSGANLRGLNASNGGDLTGEGAWSATDTAGLSWDAVTATNVTQPGCLAVDDRHLYVGYQSASTIEARSKLTGAILSSVTPPDSMIVTRLTVDQDFVVAGGGGSDDVTVAFSKPDLSAVWRCNLTGTARVATDGAAVFTSTAGTAHRVARGNRPGRWVRVDPDSLGLPFRWLAIPER